MTPATRDDKGVLAYKCVIPMGTSGLWIHGSRVQAPSVTPNNMYLTNGPHKWATEVGRTEADAGRDWVASRGPNESGPQKNARGAGAARRAEGGHGGSYYGVR
jgi:hypothetical protein